MRRHPLGVKRGYGDGNNMFTNLSFNNDRRR